MPKWLKIVLSILAVIVGIILLLFIIAKIAGFSSTMGLVYYLIEYLNFIWENRLTA